MTTFMVRKRFKKKAILKQVNLPYGTIVQAHEGFLYHDGDMLCAVRSKNGTDFFVGNDDNKGKERAKFVDDILKRLQKEDSNHQLRWDKVWADEICKKYQRKDSPDFFLWHESFYQAPIEDLQHILNIIKEI